jgi:hypothetical protein
MKDLNLVKVVISPEHQIKKEIHLHGSSCIEFIGTSRLSWISSSLVGECQVGPNTLHVLSFLNTYTPERSNLNIS